MVATQDAKPLRLALLVLVPGLLQCTSGSDGSATVAEKRAGIWISTWYAKEGRYVWASGLAPNTSTTTQAGGGVVALVDLIDPRDATLLADLTGDALDDAVVWDAATDGGLRIAPSDGSRFAVAPLHHPLGCTAPPAVAALHGDATGDGRADILCITTAGWLIAVGGAGGELLGPLQQWSAAAPLTGANRWLVDVNNDKRADAVEFSPVAGWVVHLSSGSRFDAPVSWSTAIGCPNASAVFAADVDADGCADAVCVLGRNSCWMVALSNCKDGFGTPSSWLCHLPAAQAPAASHAVSLGRGLASDGRAASASSYLMADIDNDGAQDALYFRAVNGIATWFAARSDKNSSFAASWWSMMTCHGQVMRHGKPMGGPIAEVRLVGRVFASNFSTSPTPVAVWLGTGEWKAVPPCSVHRCYGQPSEFNSWEGESIKYTPMWRDGTARTFDTAQTDAIDDTLDAITDAGLDFVIIDLTNNLLVPYILTRTQAFLLRLAERRAAGTCELKYAFALSWYWSQDPAVFEHQQDLAWSMFVSNTSYGGIDATAKVAGKPLVVQFANRLMKNAWIGYNGTKHRFNVRWAY